MGSPENVYIQSSYPQFKVVLSSPPDVYKRQTLGWYYRVQGFNTLTEYHMCNTLCYNVGVSTPIPDLIIEADFINNQI